MLFRAASDTASAITISSAYVTPVLAALGAAVVAALTAWGGYRVAKLRARVDHTTRDHSRIERLENRLDELESRLDAREDYIEKLREYISNGGPPPPPPYPWV